MPETYTSDAPPSVGDLPSGFKQDVKQVVATAVAVGWKLIVSGKESMTIVAPEPYDHKKYHFSKRRSSGPLQRIRKDIIKYADPVKLAMIDGVMDGRTDPRLFNPYDDAKVEQAELRDEEALAEKQAQKEQNKARKTAVQAAMEKAEQEKAAKEAKKKPHIVSQQPMIVLRGGDKGYPSTTTIERKWSDGTIDYKCALCDYTTKSRMGVGGHWIKHIRSGEAEPQGQAPPKDRPLIQDPSLIHEPTYSRAYTPRKDRVEALAAFLSGVDTRDPQTIAKQALCWVHEQSKKGTRLAAENEALTDAEVIDRIRMLLDRGEYLDQRAEIERLSQKIADLRDYVLTAEEEAEKATERAERAEGKLRALYDLLGDEIRGKDTPETGDNQ